MVVFSKSIVDVKIQKKRFFKNCSNSTVKFGEYAFLVKNESKIELIQLSYIKKLFKSLIKKKKKKEKIGSKNTKNSLQKNYKIWVSLLPNYVISKKSKNSRMGKGKGAFVRWVVRLRQNYVLAEFLGVPKPRLEKILIKFNKKFNMRLYLFCNSKLNNTFGLWSKFNMSFEYFNKYRAM